jgi:acyl-CoA thioester hydrolase
VTSDKPARPTRADYVSWRQATTRWADDDVYGHMNNARYFELIDTGLVVDRIGTSSVVYRIGLFQGDPEGDGAQAAAEGRFVHVYVDNTDPARPVIPVPDPIRAAVETLLKV